MFSTLVNINSMSKLARMFLAILSTPAGSYSSRQTTFTERFPAACKWYAVWSGLYWINWWQNELFSFFYLHNNALLTVAAFLCGWSHANAKFLNATKTRDAGLFLEEINTDYIEPNNISGKETERLNCCFHFILECSCHMSTAKRF